MDHALRFVVRWCLRAVPQPAFFLLPSEDSCPPPFEFRSCGSPCAGLCATHLSHQLCQDLPPCQPGCYCPKVSSGSWGDAQEGDALPNSPGSPLQHAQRDHITSVLGTLLRHHPTHGLSNTHVYCWKPPWCEAHRRHGPSTVPNSPHFSSVQGLLEQAGNCILPEQCNCWYTSGEGARVTLAPGDHLQLGCKEW